LIWLIQIEERSTGVAKPLVFSEERDRTGALSGDSLPAGVLWRRSRKATPRSELPLSAFLATGEYAVLADLRLSGRKLDRLGRKRERRVLSYLLFIRSLLPFFLFFSVLFLFLVFVFLNLGSLSVSLLFLFTTSALIDSLSLFSSINRFIY